MLLGSQICHGAQRTKSKFPLLLQVSEIEASAIISNILAP